MSAGLARLQEQLTERLFGGPGTSSFSDQIVGAGTLDPEAAIQVYADSVRTRFVGALITSYPMTFRWIGRELGLAIAHAYCEVLSPTGGEIGAVGEDFPEHSALSALGAEFVDLARFERARNRAAARAPLPALSAVATEEALLAARLAPSSSMLSTSSDVIETWMALFDGVPPPLTAGEVHHVLVWRSGLEVRQVDVDADTFIALIAKEDPVVMQRWCREGFFVAEASR